MARLSTNDTIQDIDYKLSAFVVEDSGFSGRIPIAQSCLFMLDDFYKYCENNKLNYGAYAGIIDNMELYADNLYRLYNECCSNDMAKFVAVLDGYAHEIIKKEDIDERVKKTPFGLPFDDLIC